MPTQQATSLIRRLFDEVYTKGNLEVCDELIANNVKLSDPARPHHKEGLQAFKEVEKIYTRAFPNKKLKIEDILTVDDKVVVRWTCQGVQKGDLEGIPATNKEIKITGISIYRVTNGKISEIWQSWDRLGLLEQIGEIQPSTALHK